jgi:hypothetical protein
MKTLLIAACIAAVSPLAHASPLTMGNIVVATAFSDQSTTKFGEYTPAGTLVQSYSITTPANTQKVISGVTVGPNSQPFVYAGNFNPQLWTVDPSTSVQSTRTVSGWSNVGSTVSGGLTPYKHYVFATSENAANSTGGIFRFDLDTGAALHMFDPNPIAPSGNTSYDKITLGYDGKLYALFNNGGFSSPFLVTADPDTGGGFAVTTLTESVNAIAVDASGNIYAVRGDTSSEGIDEFSPSFALLRSLNFPNGTMAGAPSSLELSPTGDLLAASNAGTVLQTTTAFGGYTTFSIASTLGAGKNVRYTQAAFVQAPVPEPASLALATAAAGLMLARPRRKLRPR